jgi:cellulose synthase/poly-beta-1,6-N-acetylglucosamine synthase-like glycosyltransferase
LAQDGSFSQESCQRRDKRYGEIMPITPGFVAMPTVLVNSFLSLLQDRSYAVRSRDSLATISPMYNEEKGAAQALASLLEQDSLPDHIVLSINGGIDATYEVVTKTLQDRGFKRVDFRSISGLGVGLEEWQAETFGQLRLTIAIYGRKASKSESINHLVEHVVTAERILVMDGDTILHPSFVRTLRDNFYRLRIQKTGKTKTFVIEDFGLQSGAVTSFAPPEASATQRFISAGREAEYAFAGVLREGQAKLVGKRGLWGNSRLYTVIGCGFTARRDMFPMPTDTETEDHDFTLACQAKPVKTSKLTRSELRRRGFRIVVKGLELTPEQFFDAHDVVTFKHSGNARYVRHALMGTEDPPHFNGFVRQIERWNGGGQQNALKRLGQRLPSNVAFTVWASLLENIIGIALLALLPILLALNVGNPSLGLAPAMLGTWFGLDLLITMLLVIYGFYRLRRAEGAKRLMALPHAVLSSLRTTLPFLVLRYINPFTYVASATRVIPAFLFRHKKKLPETGVVWERTSVRRRTRTGAVFVWNIAFFTIGTIAVANFAPLLNPINQEAWRLTYQRSFVDMNDHDYLPFMVPEQQPAGGRELAGGSLPSGGTPLGTEPEEAMLGLSHYCEPSFTKLASSTPRTLEGNPADYLYKGRWHLRMLARLAPLVPYIENAATAYDIPPELLVRIFLNESDLDPLAVGPTQDIGLAQVTSDALTLLKALATDEKGKFYNPHFFGTTFSVFDPDFSVCAGAAKLSWALRQPGVDDEQEAYALYINPVTGLMRGKISDEHKLLTQQIVNLEDMAKTLADTIAAYRHTPEKLTEAERALLTVSSQLSEGELTLEQSYQEIYSLVKSYDINDTDMYQKFLTSYFGETMNTDIDSIAIPVPVIVVSQR